MLPFRSNVNIFIVEFLCTVLLEAFYAISEYGFERALFVSLGLLPVLLVFLISAHLEREDVVTHCLTLSGIFSLYYMSYAIHTQGMLVFLFLALATTITLFLRIEVMIEYFAVTIFILLLTGLFQTQFIELFFDRSQYVAYLTMYAFAGVALIFITYNVNNYIREMKEKNEEAEAALEAKSNFLANMSHEIRTPMNAIYGMAELLEEKSVDNEEREYITTIKHSSENLLSIVNEILDFSKVDSGKMEIIEEDYDFNEMLQDIVTIIEFRMRDKNIVLNLNIDSNIPSILIGDEIRVRQILINLLNNAVKFTNQGTITLEIEWKDESRIYNTDRGLLTIRVMDTGIGISQENIAKLFTAFGQIDTKKNRNVEGTGLGLAICKRLTDAMSGRIGVESTLGKGSVFTVYLPQKIQDNTPGNFKARKSDIVSSRESYKVEFIAPTAKVLIVDDNRVNQQVAEELIGLFDIKTTTVESGREAIDRVEKHLVSYDIIFMDHMMPFMDGVEATRRIRLLEEEYAHTVPIIALTANAIKGVETQFLEAGMNDYIPKPIRLEQLANVLRKWLPERKVYPVGTPIEEIKEKEKNCDWSKLSDRERLELLDGFDTKTGIRNCAGSTKVYFDLLHTYAYSNLPTLIQNFYEKEDLVNYAVIAHSIKGASMSVGAAEVAELAYTLEQAGKRGDITYIWDHHEDMMEKYMELLKMLKSYFAPGGKYSG